MKYILPIFFSLILATSCSKDNAPVPSGPAGAYPGTGTSGDKNLPLAEREKIKSDSLFALYGLRFEKPLELSTVILSNNFYGEKSDLISYTALRNGDPWIAFYDKNNKLIKEHLEAFPDSIKNNSNINKIFSYRTLQNKEIIVITVYAYHEAYPPAGGITGNGAHFIYYYDIPKNDIKMKVLFYDDIDKLDISTSIAKYPEWYDGSFIMEGKRGNDTYYVINKDLEIINTYKGNHQYSAKRDSYYFNFTWYNNKYYPTSMTEYFEVRTHETNVIVENKSVKSVLVTPEYPFPPYYSYIISATVIEAIEKPSNYVRFDEEKVLINDLGDKIEVSIEGVMLLSDDENKSFYEEKVSGKVHIDKKTGKEIK